MIPAREEVDRSLRGAWRRTLMGNLYRQGLWANAIALFLWTLSVHAALRLGWWQPAPATVLWGTLLVVGVASGFAIFGLRRAGFSQFLRHAEREHGEIGFRVWFSLRERKSPDSIESLFFHDFARRCAGIVWGSASSYRVPGACRALFLASALGLLFLLMPWGGGNGVGIAPKPSPEPLAAESPESAGEKNEEQPVPESSKPKTARTSKPRPVEPKFVPAKEGEGAKSWKETLLYNLPVPGEDGIPAPSTAPSVSSWENWKRSAERTIRKENLDAEEIRLVTRYFDKLRP